MCTLPNKAFTFPNKICISSRQTYYIFMPYDRCVAKLLPEEDQELKQMNRMCIQSGRSDVGI